jgi:Ribulose-phosphate 3 epimerase family
MPFLPSLLEYSPQNLETKLELIKKYPQVFQIIQKSSDDKQYLHLDFVLPEFAAARDVQSGNSPKIVFDLVTKYFQDQQIVCNCHFMGSANDSTEVLKFFETYNWNPNWKYILYVDPAFVSQFLKLGIVAKGLQNKTTNVRIGTWLDLDQYSLDTKFELTNILLMTVYAGKSGQKLTDEVRSNCLKIVKSNSTIDFTVDGGWSVADETIELNKEQIATLNIISYSSFWNQFLELVNK